MDDNARKNYIEFFKKDIFAMNMGIVIESADADGAVCTLETGEGHMNADNFVQGGAIFTLADLAFAVAANADGIATPTANCSISYLRGCRGGKLTATAKPVHKGGNLCVYSVNVTDDSGALIAVATITGARRRNRT